MKSSFVEPHQRDFEPVRDSLAGSTARLGIDRRLALASLLALAACSGEGPAAGSTRALDLRGAPYGHDFRLADATGRVRTLADYRGKLVLLFFGFAQCADVCPTSMARIAEAVKLLGDDGRRVQVLFITLDPERDTPEIVRDYAACFHPDFVGLRGDVERTRATAADFKVAYRKVSQGGSYTIDHSSLTYVFDTRGQLALALMPQQGAEQQAQELRRLLRPAAGAAAASPTADRGAGRS